MHSRLVFISALATLATAAPAPPFVDPEGDAIYVNPESATSAEAQSTDLPEDTTETIVVVTDTSKDTLDDPREQSSGLEDSIFGDSDTDEYKAADIFAAAADSLPTDPAVDEILNNIIENDTILEASLPDQLIPSEKEDESSLSSALLSTSSSSLLLEALSSSSSSLEPESSSVPSLEDEGLWDGKIDATDRFLPLTVEENIKSIPTNQESENTWSTLDQTLDNQGTTNKMNDDGEVVEDGSEWDVAEELEDTLMPEGITQPDESTTTAATTTTTTTPAAIDEDLEDVDNLKDVEDLESPTENDWEMMKSENAYEHNYNYGQEDRLLPTEYDKNDHLTESDSDSNTGVDTDNDNEIDPDYEPFEAKDSEDYEDELLAEDPVQEEGQNELPVEEELLLAGGDQDFEQLPTAEDLLLEEELVSDSLADESTEDELFGDSTIDPDPETETEMDSSTTSTAELEDDGALFNNEKLDTELLMDELIDEGSGESLESPGSDSGAGSGSGAGAGADFDSDVILENDLFEPMDDTDVGTEDKSSFDRLADGIPGNNNKNTNFFPPVDPAGYYDHSATVESANEGVWYPSTSAMLLAMAVLALVLLRLSKAKRWSTTKNETQSLPHHYTNNKPSVD
ncbi:hypothetical protein J3Q64DRAFT_1727113 [Phycomyces blakesleeanus]